MEEEKKEEKSPVEQGEVKDVFLTPSEEKDLNKAVDDILADLNREPPQKSIPSIDESQIEEKPKTEKKEEFVEPLKSSEILSEMSKAVEEIEKIQTQPQQTTQPQTPVPPKATSDKDFSIFGKSPEQEVLTKEDETIAEVDKLIADKEAQKEIQVAEPIVITKISTLQKLKILAAKIIGKTIRVFIIFFTFIFFVVKNTVTGFITGAKTLLLEKELLKDVVITFIACVWLIYYFLYGAFIGLLLSLVFFTPILIQKIIEWKRSAKTH